GAASEKPGLRADRQSVSHGDSPQRHRAVERSTELTPRSATKLSSCPSSCLKRGGINWTGFVCPLPSACFVGRRTGRCRISEAALLWRVSRERAPSLVNHPFRCDKAEWSG